MPSNEIQHLEKLAQAYLENLEYMPDQGYDDTDLGYVGPNMKRPFGNSDAAADVFEIIGQPIPEEQEEITDDQIEYAQHLMSLLPAYLQYRFAGNKHADTYQDMLKAKFPGEKCPKCADRATIETLASGGE